MDEKHWYVIHTKPRNEKKVYEQVLVKEIEAFLPTIETIRIWSDRKKKIEVPLFSGYVFVHGNETERKLAISDNRGALRYIMYQKHPAKIANSEIQNIKISLQVPQKVRIEDSFISEGDMVEITDGIMRGLTGYVNQIRGNYRLMVNVIEMNMSFSIELSANEVKLLKKL
ncbi:UpxY family transcription antiterminator [bacterium]|nr:MAG: UpxY family transcription antiterminator [bacterium]